MMSHCPYCGKQTPRSGASFCSHCGKHLPAGGPARLIIQEQGFPPCPVSLNQLPVIIGREPPAGGVVVRHPTVSRQHARLEQHGADVCIIDLGSTNGTSVNGRPLQPQTPHRLRDGDIIRIGDQRGNSVGITFRSGSAPQPPGSTIHLGRLPVAQLPGFTIGRDSHCNVHLDHPTVSRLHAQVRRTPQGHEIHDRSSYGTFVNGQRVVGKRLLQANDVIQIGPFKLVYDRAGFTQHTPAGNYRLDGIRLVRQVTVGSALPLPRLRRGRSTTRRILKDIDISVYPREFVALVGSSGAGKSTLLKALSGFTPAQGQVLLNGDDLYRNFGAYRSILGYVPQDDIIHRHLTVHSALTYAAHLRLPDATDHEVGQRIADVLAQVEMAEHADKLISKLSGGQRKRVSIAVELLAEPGLFFLDEPTSGLDPGLEKKMMYTLRRLADAGRTVVLVTHATANIDQCDHVAFLADGYLAFFGPPHEALTFFGSSDFADIYTRLSHPIDPASNPPPAQWRGQRPPSPAGSQSGWPPAAQVWTECFRASAQHRQYVAGRLQSAPRNLQPAPAAAQKSGYRVSLWRQFVVLTRRYFELIRRDAVSLITLLAVMPVIGLLLLVMAGKHDLTGLPPGRIQAQIQREIDEARTNEDPAVDDEQFQGSYQVAGSAQKLLFMLALAANLLGIFAAAYEIIKEEAIYRRERMVNLKILPYLGSKVTVLGVFALLQCLLLLLVVRLKVSYPAAGVFLPPMLEMTLTLVLATLASICLGLLISALVRGQNTVIYVVLLVLFVQIIFAGAIFELPGPAQPISYLTTTRWTLEALGSTIDMDGLLAKGVTCIEPEDEQQRRMAGAPGPPCEEGQQKLAPPYQFNVNYRHKPGHLVSRWAVLIGFAAVFITMTYLAQRRKDIIS